MEYFLNKKIEQNLLKKVIPHELKNVNFSIVFEFFKEVAAIRTLKKKKKKSFI